MDGPFFCHVCGSSLAEPPWGSTGTDPTWNICPCCGCEFGYEDKRSSGVQFHRDKWVATGGQWFNPKLKPSDWNYRKQIKHIPKELPAGIERDEVTVEQRISRLLRPILISLSSGADIPDSDEFRLVLGLLEQHVPAVLTEKHPEWKRESLDGILPLIARKTGDEEAEISGLCILISDQTTTPIHLRLQIPRYGDQISWLECKLGEVGEDGMVRTKWSRDVRTKRLPALDGKVEAIDWVYGVSCGTRRS